MNGLIGNDHGNAADIWIKDIAGNAFTAIDVTLKGNEDSHYLAGGGVIGLRSTDASASISGDVTGNLFRNVKVTTISNGTSESAYIEGGGIIGVDAVSSPANKPGYALINNLTYNYFTKVKVDTGDILLGGGLVGLNNNSRLNDSATTYVELTNATGNIFGNGTDGDITVNIGYSLRGGGVIGLNGLSNAKADLKTLSGNVFAGIDVNAGTYIRGGGVVGIQVNDTDDKYPGNVSSADIGARLDTASNNLFYNIDVKSGADTSKTSTTGYGIDGGGIIGVRSNLGIASLGDLVNNDFKHLRIEALSDDLTGGGVVGVSAANWAGLSRAADNEFDDIVVTVAKGNLTGGGVIGASAATQQSRGDYTATIIGNVQNNTFNNVRISANNLTGGGFIGAVTSADFAGVNDISNNTLRGQQNIVATSGDLTGGGFAGVVATSPTNGYAFINSVNGNQIWDLKVNVSGDLTGGGVIGVVGETFSRLGTISDNTFQYLTITANSHIDGGGIIGVTSKSTNSSPYRYAGIELIDNSYFQGNKITANKGNIMGGLVYSYGLGDGMTIRNSQFVENTFNALGSNKRVYGTVTVDTGVANPNDNPHKLTLTATAGRMTLFDWNLIGDDDPKANEFVYGHTNSLYFGGIPDKDGNLDHPAAHAELVIDAQKNGDVQLNDPIRVDQTDSNYGFNMIVNGGGGRFLWGGKNIFDVNTVVDDTYKSITLENGSLTWLLGDYYEIFKDNPYEASAVFSLDAENFTFNLKPGAQLRVEGSNDMRLTQAEIHGDVRFNTGGTIWQSGSDFKYPLLTINTGNRGQTNIQDSTVGLLPFGSKDDPSLPSDGAHYYALIEADEVIAGNPVNGTARGRQGMTREYDFLIDKHGPESANDNTGKRLYAYLPAGAVPQAARATRTLTEGRAASLGFLRATWLPDHSYQQADLALYLDGTYKSWAPFAGVDGAWMRFDTRGGGRYDLSSVTGLLGIAREHKKPGESLLSGLFVEAGYGDYETRNIIHYTPNALSLSGDGDLSYVGGGVMLRKEWSNGVRLEGSFRAGRIKNELHVSEYTDPETELSARYKFAVPYYAAHVGLARTWALGERKRFELIGRYFWTRQEGKDEPLPNGEMVRYDTDDSHRVRLGGRMTFIRDERREWYLGAAGDYEFAGGANASAHGNAFPAPELHGLTGVGEIGWIYRSTKDKDFSFETGLQGYIGRMRGISGGIRMEWRF